MNSRWVAAVNNLALNREAVSQTSGVSSEGNCFWGC